MKILIIASRFFMGGFSKSLINFLLCADKYSELDITVFTLQKNEIEDYKEIPKRFKYIALDGLDYSPKSARGFSKEYMFNIQRIRNIEYILIDAFCRVSKRPIPYKTMVKFMSFSEADRARRVINDFSWCEDFEVAISWEELFCNYLLVDKIPVKKKIGYIHPNYKEVGFSPSADRSYLKRLDAIVTVSKSCKNTLRKVFPAFREKIYYIPNRLNSDRINRLSVAYKPSMNENDFNIVTVCRISDHDKAVFRIVDIVEILIKAGCRVKWYLIGDGPDLKELRHRIEIHNLNISIICLGQMDNPYPYIKKATVYVHQSYVEGRPVSVDEAIMLNTPALITDYSSAYEQIITDVSGWIVQNNIKEITAKLIDLYICREKIDSVRVKLSMIDKSNFENCLDMIKLIKSVIEKRK